MVNRENLKAALIGLSERRVLLDDKKAIIGFDGYVDEILSIVKCRKNINNYQNFNSIHEFGSFIAGNVGSCAFEVITNALKIGGNGPIMANALAGKGVKTNCIGTFGKPAIHNIFDKMSSKCNLISIGDPGYTQSFEFQDGKMMFGRHDNLDKICWQTIIDTVGIEPMIHYLDESDLIGITNWSELINANYIWHGILVKCMPYVSQNKKRLIFFDLADPSKRGSKELFKAAILIEKFNKYGEVVLGLNKKEANLLYNAICNDVSDRMDAADIGIKIKEKLQLDMLVIHSAEQVTAIENNVYCESCIRIDHPIALTGSGDNFNAGLCLGLLLKLPIQISIVIGIFVASYYIQNGENATLDELINYMKIAESAV